VKEGRRTEAKSGSTLNVIFEATLFAGGENSLSNSVRKHGHLKFGAGGRAATGRWNARGPGRFLIKEWEMSVLQPYFKGSGSLARCMAHWA